MNLNIEDYDLDDILKLFKLSSNFDETALRNAKKTVLKTHPDKSGLDKEYFLFFVKAYKILHSIHEFKTRSCPRTTTYSLNDEPDISNDIQAFLNNPKFNEKFNELFEKTQLNQESSGYGDWLKSDEDINTDVATKATMNKKIYEKKQELRSIVPVKEIEEMHTANFSDITGAEPEYYSSDVFSNLGYEDLRKAHTETVIPVTEEDAPAMQFNSKEELVQHRASQNFKPQSLQQANEYIEGKQQQQNQDDMQRAFKLARQDENNRKIQDKWMSNFKLLKD